jgi:hypothetical protein
LRAAHVIASATGKEQGAQDQASDKKEFIHEWLSSFLCRTLQRAKFMCQ